MKEKVDLIISIDKYESMHFFKRNLSPSVFRMQFSQNNIQFDKLYTNRRPDALIINYEVQSRYISQLAGTVRNIQNDDMTKLVVVYATEKKIEKLPDSYGIQLYLHKQLKPEKFQRRLLSCFHLNELIDKIVGSKRNEDDKLKLLIAEDDEKTIKLYEKFLSGIAFQTKIVKDGTDALITYDQWRPDIILLDILLPTMPGLEVLKEIRDVRKDKHPAVIMATSQGNQETVKTCIHHGIQGYILKPLDVARLNRNILDNYVMHWIAKQANTDEKKVSKNTSSATKSKEISKTASKIKLLLIDDDPKIIQLYQKFLSPKAYDIKTAANIQDGLECYQTWSPDMIVLDIIFPEMSGIKLLKEIRENAKDVSTTIVMATVQKKDSVIKECLQYNIQGYLLKPFDVNNLNQTLFKCHQKNQNRKIKHTQ
jgi:CheY-like chemotaxis protein